MNRKQMTATQRRNTMNKRIYLAGEPFVLVAERDTLRDSPFSLTSFEDIKTAKGDYAFSTQPDRPSGTSANTATSHKRHATYRTCNHTRPMSIYYIQPK
jgi:ABC-type molybdate transport system substrate-binding protein